MTPTDVPKRAPLTTGSPEQVQAEHAGHTSSGQQELFDLITTILVVDDNEDSVSALVAMLEDDGYLIRVAYNVAQALTVIKTNSFDAAVLDIGLPDGTGFELAEQIRREAWGGKSLLIAHTGWGSTEDEQRSREAGFDHHLTKPLNYSELLGLLQRKNQS